MADEVGGIFGTVTVDTTGFDSAIARVRTGTAQMAASFDVVDLAMEDLARTATRTNAAIAQAGRASETSSRGTAAFARGMMEVSRGFEDFVVAGPLGVMNNIPQIMTNMAQAAGVAAGAVAGLTAGVSLLTTGAYILYRNWDSVTSLWTTKNPFPKSADDLENMQGRLKEVTRELDALKGLQSLDNTQLARANTLVSERARLEKEVTEEKRKQSELEQFRRAKSEEETGRGGAFMKAVGGESEVFEATLTEAYRKLREQDIARARARMLRDVARSDAGSGTDQEKLDFANRRQGEFANYARGRRAMDLRPMVEEMIRGLQAGDPKAMASLRGLMGAGTGVVVGGEGFRGRLAAGIPETRAEREQREMEARGRIQGRAIERQMDEKTRAAAAANGRAIDAQTDEMLKFKRADDAARRDLKVAAPEIADNVREFLEQDAREREQMGERGADLQWRLRQLMNPAAVGQSLSLDAYEASIKARTGDSPEVQRLREINQTLRDIERHQKNVALIGAKRRGGG